MKVKEIKSSINKAIINNIPYPINSNDVKEGYQDGSFFITFTRARKIQQANTIFKRELSIRVHYFPKNRANYSIECYEMQDRLESIFNKHLTIGDRTITINDTDSIVHEGVLLFDFDIEFYETQCDSVENDGEIMQILNLNQKG